jgi:hypothetical protein
MRMADQDMVTFFDMLFDCLPVNHGTAKINLHLPWAGQERINQ